MFQEDSWELRSVGLTILTLLPFLLYFWHRRKASLILDPTTYFFLTLFASVGAKTIAILFLGDRVFASEVLHERILGSQSPRVLTFGYMANLTFVYAYFIGLFATKQLVKSTFRVAEPIRQIGRWISSSLGTTRQAKVFVLALLLAVLALALFAVLYIDLESVAGISKKRLLTENNEADPYRFYSGRYAIFKLAGVSKVVCLLALTSYCFASRQNSSLAVFLSALATFFVFSTVFSIRAQWLLLCLEASLLCALARVPRWRYAVAGLVVLGLLGGSLSTALRMSPALSPAEIEDSTAGADRERDIWWASADSSIEQQALRVFARIASTRYFSDISKLSVLGLRWEDEGFWLHGQTLYSWITLPLGDNDLMTFAELSRFLGSRVFGAGGSDVTPGFLAEFYVNFAWPGVVVGSLLLGSMALFIRRWSEVAGREPAQALLFSLLVLKIYLLMLNSSVGSAALNFLTEMAVVLALVFVAWPLNRGTLASASIRASSTP